MGPAGAGNCCTAWVGGLDCSATGRGAALEGCSAAQVCGEERCHCKGRMHSKDLWVEGGRQGAAIYFFECKLARVRDLLR